VKKIVFVTGTGTGVGKTVLTGLLLAHLRGQGRNALGMKPFCSGSRGDARLLHDLQNGCLTLDDVNPFYFDKPLAPAAAPNPPAFQEVLARIRALADRSEVLLVEGAGGLLAPLGVDYTARELINALDCETIIASSNQLGTINHTLLTVEALQRIGIKKLAIVLMGVRNPDISSDTNDKLLRRWIRKVPVYSIPRLRIQRVTPRAIKNNATFLKKVLARLC
jgi:dethiobiotin synthetase